MEIVTREQAIERGLVNYYTGEPCSKGHIAKRNTRNASCADCMKEAQRRHREEVKRKLARAQQILAERGEG